VGNNGTVASVSVLPSQQQRSLNSPSYKRYLKKQGQTAKQKPNVEIANTLPTDIHFMDNETIVTLGALGDQSAREEILKRHIMSVDSISYDDACVIFKKIEEKNTEGRVGFTAPYYTGITLALAGCAVSFPMVFDLKLAVWFNKWYVTTDIPEPRDLETWLEVGAWTWNWMEPIMGQLSFALLCLQYSRSQMDNLGVKPYTKKVKEYRASKLADAFPQYKREIITNYSRATPLTKLFR